MCWHEECVDPDNTLAELRDERWLSFQISSTSQFVLSAACIDQSEGSVAANWPIRGQDFAMLNKYITSDRSADVQCPDTQCDPPMISARPCPLYLCLWIYYAFIKILIYIVLYSMDKYTGKFIKVIKAAATKSAKHLSTFQSISWILCLKSRWKANRFIIVVQDLQIGRA